MYINQKNTIKYNYILCLNLFEFICFIIFYVIGHVGQGQGVNGIEPELLVVELFEKRNISNLAALLVDLIFKIWIFL